MLYKVQQHCDVNLSKKRKFTSEDGMSNQDEKIKKYIYINKYQHYKDKNIGNEMKITAMKRNT